MFLSQLSLVLTITATWGFAAGSQSSLTPLTPAVHSQLSPLPVKTPSEGLLGTSFPTPIPSASQSSVISSLMPGPSVHPSIHPINLPQAPTGSLLRTKAHILQELRDQLSLNYRMDDRGFSQLYVTLNVSMCVCLSVLVTFPDASPSSWCWSSNDAPRSCTFLLLSLLDFLVVHSWGFKGPLHKMLPHLTSPPYPQPRPSVRRKLQSPPWLQLMVPPASQTPQTRPKFFIPRPGPSPISRARNLTTLPLFLPPALISPQFFTILSPKAFSHLLLAFPHPHGQCRHPGNSCPLSLLPGPLSLLLGPLGWWVCSPPLHLRRDVPVSLLSSLSFRPQTSWGGGTLGTGHFSSILCSEAPCLGTHSSPARPPPPAR